MFWACGKKDTPNNMDNSSGKRYGGILSWNEPEYIKSLFPPSITDIYSYHVANQVYEGLFAFSPDSLQLEKRLVADYKLDSTGLMYTFNLKKSVYFHDNACFTNGKGRELIAADVVYCLKKLCSNTADNLNFEGYIRDIKFAQSYFSKSKQENADEVPIGIKTTGKHSFQIELTQRNPQFIYQLAKPASYIYPKEAVDKYGKNMRIKMVGTGPYVQANFEEETTILLKRNEHYHRVDNENRTLPYLDGVKFSFIKDKNMAYLNFKKGLLNIIYKVSTEHVIDALQPKNEAGNLSSFEYLRVPEMATQMIIFNPKGILAHKMVRKAFNYAIDREKIVNMVLNGENAYAAGHHGVVPPVFSDYNIELVEGYQFNADTAKFLLSKAGYPNANNIPPIKLLINAEGNRNTLVMEEVQKQLKEHLNIDVEIEILPFAMLNQRGMQGDYEMIRVTWYADYPTPTNFLWPFYTGAGSAQFHYPNLSNYRNRAFNQIYQQAVAYTDSAQHNLLLKQAEQTLLEDAPFMVLWYEEGYYLNQTYVKGFRANPMQYLDFSQVYFQRAKQLN